MFCASGIQFKQVGEWGDFEWMLKQSYSCNTFFIYPCQAEMPWVKRAGSAVVAPLSLGDRPQSAGIPVWDLKVGSYKQLTPEIEKMLTRTIYNIEEKVRQLGYSCVYWPVDADWLFGTREGTEVGQDVKIFITRTLERVFYRGN
jgi:hypothetical protein